PVLEHVHVRVTAVQGDPGAALVMLVHVLRGVRPWDRVVVLPAGVVAVLLGGDDRARVRLRITVQRLHALLGGVESGTADLLGILRGRQAGVRHGVLLLGWSSVGVPTGGVWWGRGSPSWWAI